MEEKICEHCNKKMECMIEFEKAIVWWCPKCGSIALFFEPLYDNEYNFFIPEDQK